MAEWHSFCRGRRDLKVLGDTLIVEFESGRTHTLRVEEYAGHYALKAIVARTVEALAGGSPEQRAWTHNRTVDLLGFRIDERGRFVGDAWIPKLGLTPVEFILVALHLAAECDRMEYVLTGEDRE